MIRQEKCHSCWTTGIKTSNQVQMWSRWSAIDDKHSKAEDHMLTCCCLSCWVLQCENSLMLWLQLMDSLTAAMTCGLVTQSEILAHRSTLEEKCTILLVCWMFSVFQASAYFSVLITVCYSYAYIRPDWPAEALCSWPVHLSFHPFVCPLPHLSMQYFENEWTNCDASWHKWSAEQWHETYNCS